MGSPNKTTPTKNKKVKPKKTNLVSQWDEIRKDLNAGDVQFISRIIYRDWFRMMVRISLGLLIALILAIVWVVTGSKQPEPKYFAQQLDGNWVEIQPLSTPILNSQAIINFSVKAIEGTYNFSFSNYQKVLNQATSRYFTDGGTRALNEAMTIPGGILDVVQKGRYVVSTVLKGQPRIIQSGQIGDRYAWRVVAPVIIRYESQSDEKSNHREIVLTLIRTPQIDIPEGVGISQFTIQKGSL